MLSKLTMRENGLATTEAGEALGEALKSNTVLEELDISSNAGEQSGGSSPKADSIGFVRGLCKGLVRNKALASVNLLQNNVSTDQVSGLQV
jgi:hypothetical protein